MPPQLLRILPVPAVKYRRLVLAVTTPKLTTTQHWIDC